MKKILNYHPSKWQAISFLVIPIFIGLLTSTSFDNDIWFLINTGRYILNHGFPTIDPFTIHEGFHLVIQQWIPDVIFYELYHFFGKIGLYLFTNFVNIYIVFITYKLLMTITDGKRNLSILFTFIITVFISFSFIVSRPQIFSISFLLTELYLLEKYEVTNNKKYLIGLPLLSILMINFHASMWLLLFCFFIPFIVNKFSFKIGKITSDGGSKRNLIIIGIIMALCGFINPYGIHAMTYVFTSWGVPVIDQYVSEMAVPSIHTIRGIGTFVLVFSVYLIYMLFYKKKINVRHFLLLIGTTYLALSSYRGILFFIIAAIYPLAYYFKNHFYYIREPKNSNHYLLLFFIMTILFIIVPTLFIIKNDLTIMNSSMKNGIDKLSELKDVSEVKLYCNYGECNYAEYLGIKVYIDSRAEIFIEANNHKEDILTELYLLQNHAIYYKDFIDKYQFTHLLVKETDVLYQNLLHDDDYEIMYRGLESKTDHKFGNFSMDRWHYILFRKIENN